MLVNSRMIETDQNSPELEDEPQELCRSSGQEEPLKCKLPEFRKANVVRHLTSCGGITICVWLLSLWLFSELKQTLVDDETLTNISYSFNAFQIFLLMMISIIALQAFFLKKMKTSHQPQGTPFLTLEITWRRRIQTNPHSLLLPLSILTVLLLLFLVLLSQDALAFVFVAYFGLCFYAMGFLLFIFRDKRLFFTGKGFGIYPTGSAKPILLFWLWNSFKGFRIQDQRLELLPKYPLLGANFKIIAGNDIEKLRRSISSHLPEETVSVSSK